MWLKYFGVCKGNANPYSLHAITGPLMMLGRCFGLFPVCGLLDPNPENVRLNVLSPYSLICLTSIVGQMIFVVISLMHLFENLRVPRLLYLSVLNVSSITCTLFTIFILARDWPLLVQQAAIIEKSLPKCNRRRATSTCNLVVALVFLTALADIGFSINFYVKFTAACIDGKSFVESYYINTMAAQSTYLPYSTWTFVLLQVVNFQMTFATILIDVLLTVVSLYLTSHFEELNDMIVLYKNKYPNIWHVIRARYAKLIRFVKLINDNLSYFVLFSFGFNFSLICVHLFKMLRKTDNYVLLICEEDTKMLMLRTWDRRIHFTFSFMTLIVRIMIVAFSAARLHSTAHASVSELHDVPTSCYNTETRRLHELMKTNTVALTGKHFFYVTRKSIFSMAASIFTYEIMLLQFADVK